MDETEEGARPVATARRTRIGPRRHVGTTGGGASATAGVPGRAFGSRNLGSAGAGGSGIPILASGKADLRRSSGRVNTRTRGRVGSSILGARRALKSGSSPAQSGDVASQSREGATDRRGAGGRDRRDRGGGAVVEGAVIVGTLPLPALGDPPRCPAHECLSDHDAERCQADRVNSAIRRTRDGAQFQMTKAEALWVLDVVRARIAASTA